MKQFTPNSSQVALLKYYENDSVLEVVYKSNKGNKAYMYYDVPETVYNELITAESVGKYLAANIKGKYEYKQIPVI